MEERDEIRGDWKFEGGSRMQQEDLEKEDVEEGEFGGRGVKDARGGGGGGASG